MSGYPQPILSSSIDSDTHGTFQEGTNQFQPKVSKMKWDMSK